MALHWLPWRGRRVDLGHTEIAAGHVMERFRLFFVVVLGETVLTMGTAFADAAFGLERLVALGIAFLGTVALWWCYFQRAEAIGVAAAEDAEDAGAVGLVGTWTLTLVVIALTAIAVADELAIASPVGHVTVAFAVLASGGTALFLLAQLVFHRSGAGQIPRSRPLGIAALTVLAVATCPLTLIAGMSASTAVLLAVAGSDTRRTRDPAPRTTT